MALTGNGRRLGRALCLGHLGGRSRRGGLRLRGRGRLLLLSVLGLEETPLDVLEGGHQGSAAGGGGGPARDALSDEAGGLGLALAGGQRAAGLCRDVERLRRGEQETQQDDGGPHGCVLI